MDATVYLCVTTSLNQQYNKVLKSYHQELSYVSLVQSSQTRTKLYPKKDITDMWRDWRKHLRVYIPK